MNVNMNTERFMNSLIQIWRKWHNGDISIDEAHENAYQLGALVCAKGVKKPSLETAFSHIYEGAIGSIFTPRNFQAILSLKKKNHLKSNKNPERALLLSDIKGTIDSCKGNDFVLNLYYSNLKLVGALMVAPKIQEHEPSVVFIYCSLLQNFCLGFAES